MVQRCALHGQVAFVRVSERKEACKYDRGEQGCLALPAQSPLVLSLGHLAVIRTAVQAAAAPGVGAREPFRHIVASGIPMPPFNQALPLQGG